MSPTPPAASPRNPVLVTGGTGFLGRRLVERLLDQGRPVSVLARSPAPDLEARGVRFIPGSIMDPDAVQAACAGTGTVFHVAAKVGVWGRRADYFRMNIQGTQAVVDGCRKAGVPRLVYTSTSSVVYNGRDLSGADESLPLTTKCPCPYPLTKALGEDAVLAANSPGLKTISLRPHLIWGPGDRHLIPRLLAQARSGRLRITGSGQNRVDFVHVENVVDAHLLAEASLAAPRIPGPEIDPPSARGRAYFITNGEPVSLWGWINELLSALGRPPVTRVISFPAATAIGVVCEAAWRILPLAGEPPLTRFVAFELAKDHWFDISAARRDLGYLPRISMAAGMAELVQWIKATGL
jgi:2-alkyl-3-oxoalkanoate reductase